MLRRRGVGTTLVYGGTSTGGRLQAHVWLQSGDQSVVGGDGARHFAIVRTYSNFSPSSALQETRR
jgi:hypothetical protein